MTSNFQNLNNAAKADYRNQRTYFIQEFYDEKNDEGIEEFDEELIQEDVNNQIAEREFGNSKNYIHENVVTEYKKLTGGDMLMLLRFCEESYTKRWGVAQSMDGVGWSIQPCDESTLYDYLNNVYYVQKQCDYDFVSDAKKYWDSRRRGEAEETDESEGEEEYEKLDFHDTLQGEKLRIIHEREWVDIKPYSHNIISLTLRVVASKYGQEEANKLIDECELEILGWKKVKIEIVSQKPEKPTKEFAMARMAWKKHMRENVMPQLRWPVLGVARNQLRNTNVQ